LPPNPVWTRQHIRRKLCARTAASDSRRGPDPSERRGRRYACVVETPTSYFSSLGSNKYRPTTLTGGAWTPSEQHISPMGGLIVHAVDKFVAERGGDDRQIARLSVDILGPLSLDDFEI